MYNALDTALYSKYADMIIAAKINNKQTKRINTLLELNDLK